MHAAALAASLSLVDAAANLQPVRLADLAELELEQLAAIRVTSASRREEGLLEAPASIFVITAEDIRRAGATSLPEALRLAPNLQVMRGDTSQYVVSARGGLTTTANKMLVLVDGRTVYTPLFSGVFYDALTIALEDVDRIEVVSGPGSTLYGTNAVNGVINVISKSARRTLGGLVTGGAGDQERGAHVRYGASTGPEAAVRVYGRYFDRDDHRLASGAGSARDNSYRWVAGARGDWERGTHALTAQAETYAGGIGNLAGDRPVSGGHALGRWRKNLGGDSSLTVQAYMDRAEREHIGSFKERLDTLDIDAQHSLVPVEGHQLTWGGGYRHVRDRTEPTPALGFVPADRSLRYANLYVQDEVRLGERLRATVGVRAEHNTYTGLEWLPNLRLSYGLGADHILWSALTRTVRSPSRIDRDLVVPGAPPFLLVNNDGFESEVANVFELGYRGRIAANATVSLTLFHHRFQDLRTAEPLGTQLVLANGAEGRAYGAEGWADLRVTSDWRLVGGFTWMRDRTELMPGRVNLAEDPIGNNPRRTVSLRSLWNLSRALELDFFVRHVGALRNPAVDAYTTVDARLGWRPLRDVELSLVVANVADREHAEFGAPGIRAEFGRAVFVKGTWVF